jgi:hypothetical protein
MPAALRQGLTRPRLIVIVAGVLLIADLLLLPWTRFAINIDTKGLGFELPEFSFERTGVQAPFPVLGVAALVAAGLTVALAVSGVRGRATAQSEHAQVILSAAAFGFMAAKAIAGEYLSTGAWIGLLLGAALAFGAYLVSEPAEISSDGTPQPLN